MVERRRIDDELRVRIEDDQIRVEPHLDRSLRMLQTGKPSRCLAEPSRKAFDRHASLNGAGPHSRQPDLQRCDAAPRAQKIAVVEMFERRWRRRMIRGDEVDRASRARSIAPSRSARPRIGGAHLNAGGAVRDLLGGERQVVRAGLDGQRRHPAAARRRSRRPPPRDARCTMCTRVRTPRRAAPASRSPRARSSGGRLASHVAYRRDPPSVPASRSASPAVSACASSGRRTSPGPAAPRADPPRSTCANSSTPDGRRKHLNPSTPARASGSRSRDVPRNDASPEAHVHVALPARRRALRVKRRDGRRRRECC